jgi:exosortase/archaeosortase family protein
LRFLVQFGCFLLLGGLVLALPSVKRNVKDPWITFNASAAAAMTRALGFEASATGPNLNCGGGTLTVKEGCDGVLPFLILASAILAFPVAWGRRALGVAMGAFLIAGVNVARLVSLLLVSAYHPDQLELFHVYVWQTLMGILALGAFLVWGTFLAGRK